MAVHIERRRHKQYTTRNSEYHLRGQLCVGVRNRSTGIWITEHEALGTRLLGSLARTAHGFALAPTGEIGSALWFNSNGFDVVTGVVREMNRPHRSTILHYL